MVYVFLFVFSMDDF